MRKRRDKQKYYRTHPAVKAALALSILLTVSVCAASYGFYMYMRGEAEEVAVMRDRCAYEAYVSLGESLSRGDTETAAEALSRCELFSGCEKADHLRGAILSGEYEGVIEESLALGDGADISALIADALRRADETARGKAREAAPRVSGGAVTAASWETLDRRIEISEDEAHRIAVQYVGGGAGLKRAENHTFPLVYTFTCKNAAVDVTRMGGRLLRFYAFRHGGAAERSPDVCREAAGKFISEAGIVDGVLISETEVEDGFEYIYCGSFVYGDSTVVCTSETVKVGVHRAGAMVNYFDAYEYYRNKPISYGGHEVNVSRADAAEALGTDGGKLSLIFDGERLYWSLSGAKSPLVDAENGEIRVENP